MVFIGRERELNQLEQLYQRPGFQMCVLYGRRRIGKTALLNRFAEGKRQIFFTAVEEDLQNNLRSFSEGIFSCFSTGTVHPQFQNFEDALSFIVEQAGDERVLIVIDEFPYLLQADKSAASVLQKQIDTRWEASNLFLILCGSSVSVMEEEVLGTKSPLYGRRTAQLEILPLDYLSASRFTESYSAEEKALIYGATGGVPKYLALLNPGESADENLARLFFTESGYLFEEPGNLLRQEFRNVALYGSIIGAVAGGAGQMNEIALRTGCTTAQLAQAIARLTAVRIMRKDIPLLNEKNRRYAEYRISDGMFRFWYRYVAGAVGLVERGYGEDHYASFVRPLLHEFMGSVFEDMCRDYTLRLSARGELHTHIEEIGHWRGHDDRKREPADIDVVGVNRRERSVVIGECKFRNAPPRSEDVETVLDRAGLLAGYHVTDLLFFSLANVPKGLKRKYSDRVRFIGIDEIYER